MLEVGDMVRLHHCDGEPDIAIGEIVGWFSPIEESARIRPIVCFNTVLVNSDGVIPLWNCELLEKVDRLTALILGGQRNA